MSGSPPGPELARPVVSVVMIFLDAERFIDEAIASVLAQDLEPIELVLVDDGSRDGSVDIARRAAQADARVRYLDHPGHANLGMSAARNAGVSHATGDLLAFLDADDRWDVDHLRRQVELLAVHPAAGLVCGPAWRWRSWAGTGLPDDRQHLGFPHSTEVPRGQMLLSALEHDDRTVPMCSLLVRRAVWELVAGAERAFSGMYEDQVLLAKLHLAAASVTSDACTAWYRRHPDSACSRAARKGVYDPTGPSISLLRYLEWLDRYLVGHPCGDVPTDRALREALDRARRPFGNRTVFLLEQQAGRVVSTARILGRRLARRARRAVTRSA